MSIKGMKKPKAGAVHKMATGHKDSYRNHGYTLFEDGSIALAPCDRAIFDRLGDESASLEVLAERHNHFLDERSTAIRKQYREHWETMREMLAEDFRDNFIYRDGKLISKKVETPALQGDTEKSKDKP